MSGRKIPLAVGEFYHCYTRGIDKRVTFQSIGDYERFLQALYVCNDVRDFDRASLSDGNFFHRAILARDRDTPIVSIVAYCLMPNHYHLVLHEIIEGGISRFMQKMGTLYTMYFNSKNERIGSLFVTPFRSKHINDDAHLRRVIPYIHLNPVELFEPKWKEGKVRDIGKLKKKLMRYRFSSLPDYLGETRPENSILDWGTISDIHDRFPSIGKVVNEAAEYYRTLKW